MQVTRFVWPSRTRTGAAVHVAAYAHWLAQVVGLAGGATVTPGVGHWTPPEGGAPVLENVHVVEAWGLDPTDARALAKAALSLADQAAVGYTRGGRAYIIEREVA